MSSDLVLVKNLHVGGLAKPVTALVNKVSYALGGPFIGAFRPMQIRRVAEAEADAIRIHAQADADAAAIRQRTANRLLAAEMRNQAVIESVLERAIPHLKEDAEPDKIEDDWIVNFFDKCRTVSEEQMQGIWARILAGEANNPGTISRKTVNLLSDMDKSDAEVFTTFCGLLWDIRGFREPMVFEGEQFYGERGISFEVRANLEALGLIKDSPLGISLGMRKQTVVSYFDRPVELTLSDEANGKMSVGSVYLTPAGRQLERVCEAKPIDGFFEFICHKWNEDPKLESIRVLG